MHRTAAALGKRGLEHSRLWLSPVQRHVSATRLPPVPVLAQTLSWYSSAAGAALEGEHEKSQTPGLPCRGTVPASSGHLADVTGTDGTRDVKDRQAALEMLSSEIIRDSRPGPPSWLMDSRLSYMGGVRHLATLLMDWNESADCPAALDWQMSRLLAMLKDLGLDERDSSPEAAPDTLLLPSYDTGYFSWKSALFRKRQIWDDVWSKDSDPARQRSDNNSAEKRGRRFKVRTLPASASKNEIIHLVAANHVSIIAGNTGTGKTTQVPQMLLENPLGVMGPNKARGHVLCCQPRRMAAVSMAHRVAMERDDPAPGIGPVVGYSVRFDNKSPRLEDPARPGGHGSASSGSILFCTTGILINNLRVAPDKLLDSVTHIILDEVHERHVETDYILALLKTVMLDRLRRGQGNPKLVLMSATVDIQKFLDYFEDIIYWGVPPSERAFAAPPVMEISGYRFQVRPHFLQETLHALKDTYSVDEMSLIVKDVVTGAFISAENVYLMAHNQLEAFERKKQREAAGGVKDGGASKPKEAGKNRKGAKAAKAAEAQERDAKNKLAILRKVVDATTDLSTNMVPLGLVATLVAHIVRTTSKGGILVFLPGIEEINKVTAMLMAHEGVLGINFRDPYRFALFRLHSSLRQAQQAVFGHIDRDRRRIVLATDIAETSITIPDIGHVIDAGRHRRGDWENSSGTREIGLKWISQANMLQRKGRGGRTAVGAYYGLYAKPRLEAMALVEVPQIQRSNLQDLCLQVATQALVGPSLVDEKRATASESGVATFLASTMDPPDPASVQTAIASLGSLGALVPGTDRPTSLGHLISRLRLTPPMGKLALLGIIFRCLDPALIIAAASEFPSGIVATEKQGWRQATRNNRAEFAAGQRSDHLAIVNMFRGLRQAAQLGREEAWEFCLAHSIDHTAFRNIETRTLRLYRDLVNMGLVDTGAGSARDFRFGGARLNENSEDVDVLRAAITAALGHQNVAVHSGGEKFTTAYKTEWARRPRIPHHSVNGPRDSGIYETGRGIGRKPEDDWTPVLGQAEHAPEPAEEAVVFSDVMRGSRVLKTGKPTDVDDVFRPVPYDESTGNIDKQAEALNALMMPSDPWASLSSSGKVDSELEFFKRVASSFPTLGNQPMWLNDTTVVTPLTVALFAGSVMEGFKEGAKEEEEKEKEKEEAEEKEKNQQQQQQRQDEPQGTNRVESRPGKDESTAAVDPASQPESPRLGKELRQLWSQGSVARIDSWLHVMTVPPAERQNSGTLPLVGPPTPDTKIHTTPTITISSSSSTTTTTTIADLPLKTIERLRAAVQHLLAAAFRDMAAGRPVVGDPLYDAFAREIPHVLRAYPVLAVARNGQRVKGGVDKTTLLKEKGEFFSEGESMFREWKKEDFEVREERKFVPRRRTDVIFKDGVAKVREEYTPEDMRRAKIQEEKGGTREMDGLLESSSVNASEERRGLDV